MDHSPKISITLSADLLNHLRQLSQAQHVPLSWLVTGLICDTIVACNEQPRVPDASQSGIIPAIPSSPAWN